MYGVIDVRADRVPIITMRGRARRFVGLGLLCVVMGAGSIWAGWSGNVGTFSWTGTSGRVAAVAGGVVLVVMMSGLILSNFVFGWAVLVGEPEGLQVIYPLGLHRWSARSRLRGRLDQAAVKARESAAGKRGRAGLTFVTITAPEGTLEFSFAADSANADWQQRFRAWAESRGAGGSTG
jgi:hypothetical protein